MNYLITGGAGFIGGNFIHYMMEVHPNDKVICMDKLTYSGNLETLSSKLCNEYLGYILDETKANNEVECATTTEKVAPLNNPNFTFVKGDICDRKTVDEVFEAYRPDVVINFAAESHVDRSIDDPEIFLRTNILGTQVLMDACRKYTPESNGNQDCEYGSISGVIDDNEKNHGGLNPAVFKGVRFHQVSTDEVYGDLPIDCPELLFTESTPLHASSPYSASKAAADLLVLAYHRTYKLPITISRCSNNYGAYHFPEKLIPLMIINALKDKPLPVYGKGINVRDWLYVIDHCKAIDLILERGKIGDVYNIGGHNEIKNIDIVKIILNELGKSEELITFVRDRDGHDLRYAIDASKIEKLGWIPKTSFSDGIKKTIRWYLENKEWWSRILDGQYSEYYAKHYDILLSENRSINNFQ